MSIYFKQCFKGDPKRGGYVQMPKQQGVTVPQGKLGAPGRLVVKTLISVQTEYFTR